MTIALSADDAAPPSTSAVERLPGLATAALASLGAGAIHAAAVGIHTEHTTLTRIFIAAAVFQLGWGVAALARPSRWLAAVGAVGSAAIVAGWVVTRLTGISSIQGLESREAAQLADTLCAALGAVAAGAALAATLIGPRRMPRPGFTLPAVSVALLAVVGMVSATTHSHDGHDHDVAGAAHSHDAGDDHAHDGDAHEGELNGDHSHDDADGVSLTDGHAHDDDADHAHDPDAGDDHDHEVVWPRPFDPDLPLDISGVPGVTPEQEERARQLVLAAQRDLPAFADVATARELGYNSIGDAGTGFEHYINRSLIDDDDKFLDPTAPESLVYQVDGDDRILVSAMFIAPTGTPIDDPQLVDFAGPLMEWHIHDDLCWGLVNGVASVVGLIDAQGNCPPGSIRAGSQNPMVHVWISPHQCGPFAALEGVGAGRAADGVTVRADQCGHDHGDGGHGDHTAVVPPEPYDPTKPINLSGVEGVTPEQQARAENLIAVTLRYLPRYADYRDAEADGFRSIRDGLTGYEHFINWSYLDDEHELDPLYPESLVYQRAPDGSRQLVAAMYMVAGVTLDEVPDVGGVLTQWHIHNDLCMSSDPMETGEAWVVGVMPPDRPCNVGVRLRADPMLHVWIVPHECGPFAALEGVAGGQIKEGEERWCDHAHGTG